MQENVKSISLRELTWSDVDDAARKHHFLDRSPFVEHCIDKEIHKHKRGDIRLFEVLLLLMMAVSSLLLVLIFMRGG